MRQKVARGVVGLGLLISLWVALLFGYQFSLQSWWQTRIQTTGNQALAAINADTDAILALANDDLAGRLILLEDALSVYLEHAPYRQVNLWQLRSVRVNPLTFEQQAVITAPVISADREGQLTLSFERQQAQAKLTNLYFELQEK